MDYVIEAVDLIGRYGYRPLADYEFDPVSGHWHHRRMAPQPSLGMADLLDVALSTPAAPAPSAAPLVAEGALTAGYLNQARSVLAGGIPVTDEVASGLPGDLEALREFHLPPVCLPSPSSR